MKQKTNETVEKSTKQQAIAWWNNLQFNKQCFLRSKYHSQERQLNSLTGREIEEIWRKEILQTEVKKDIENALKSLESKSNAKQFKQFDESLHKAYLNKFSNEDKFKAFISNLNELSNELQFNAFIVTLKKMKLDSQIESNIMTLVALKDI